ncbi:type VI secretion system tube protein Hcp [Mixta calida]|nr:type VI secretion system tube protein Hcp [Mixta calida]
MESIFLKIDSVSGESKDSAHPGWIDVTSYTWGVWRNGDAAGPGASRYRNLSVQCAIDKATAAVLLFASNGNRIKATHLSLCKARNGMIESCRVSESMEKPVTAACWYMATAPWLAPCYEGR